MNEAYTADYIKRALTSPKIEAPNSTEANGSGEILNSLYEAHRLGGMTAAQGAWETIKRLRPDVAHMERSLPKVIHADDLKHLSKPIYLLTYYPIYKYGFNVLIGASGGGKSFVALDIAGRIATSEAIVYIAGEGLHGYAARWEAWKSFNRVESTKMWFFTEALQVLQENELHEFIDLIGAYNPAIVVIDTLARSAVGVEENSAREMGMFVGACDLLRSRLNTSVLVIHHTGKDGMIRGSSALYGAADSVLSLQNTDGVIHLYNDPEHGGKNKHAPAAAPIYLQIKPHEAAGFAGAVVVPAEKMVKSAENLTENQQAVLTAIAEYENGVGARAIIETTGLTKPTTYRILGQLSKLKLISLSNEVYSLTEEGESQVSC